MARALQKEDSVYDFLYVDTRRLAHFLSQFSQYGHLTSLTRAVSTTDTSSGGLNVHVAKIDTSESEQTTQTRAFDTQWVAPLSFLDQANERGLINRDNLGDARIGSLHLISGALAVFDFSVIKVMWKLPALRATVTTAFGQTKPETVVNRHDRRKSERDRNLPSKTEAESALDLLEALPHAIVASMNDGTNSAWGTLKEESLIVSSSDLMLKHGVRIAGKWNIVGIVDALPSHVEDQNAPRGISTVESNLGSLGAMISEFVPAIQGMLGRPESAYGVTPLLIFREVSG